MGITSVKSFLFFVEIFLLSRSWITSKIEKFFFFLRIGFFTLLVGMSLFHEDCFDLNANSRCQHGYVSAICIARYEIHYTLFTIAKNDIRPDIFWRVDWLCLKHDKDLYNGIRLVNILFWQETLNRRFEKLSMNYSIIIKYMKLYLKEYENVNLYFRPYFVRFQFRYWRKWRYLRVHLFIFWILYIIEHFKCDFFFYGT